VVMDLEDLKTKLNVVCTQTSAIKNENIYKGLMLPVFSSLEDKLKTAENLLDEMEQINSMMKYREPSTANNPSIKLNVGGRNIDIKRSKVLEQEKNLHFLSFLFLSSLWNDFFLKDKKNRIYFDYELKWLEPIFSSLFFNSSVTVFH
jgi:hypothetical protein